MAPFTTSHYFKALTFTILSLKTVAFDPIPLFSLPGFEKDPKFKSNVVALYGNASVVNDGGGSEFHLYGSGGSGTGRVMYKKPIKLVEGKPKQLVSFSTCFAFSILLENGGGGLVFVMVPNGSESDVFDKSSSGFPFGLKNRISKVIGVEFSTSRDDRNGVSSFSNVAINVGNNSVHGKISNSSSINLALRSGLKLHAWIDYEASSRRLEVRLSQHGNSRPSDPLLWHSIDLSNVLKEKEMFVGFSPVKGNPSQVCFLYSWSFVLRHFSHSMHSKPLDPKVLDKKNTETPMVRLRNDCFLRVLAAMIFGTGCGALAAFIVLYMCTIFGNKRPMVVPEECVMQPVDYRKVNIVVDKTIEDSK